MATSSLIESGMIFQSYKIIEMQIKSSRQVALLFTRGDESEAEWEFSTGFADINLLNDNENEEDTYLVPLLMGAKLLSTSYLKKKKKKGDAHLKVEGIIAGIFSFTQSPI